ncbi:MAG: hypothetical protein HUJ26_17525 [Planctomycetaceae bacterium]|nr:hypothetical protein [Planctomycetaceae bacterium]
MNLATLASLVILVAPIASVSASDLLDRVRNDAGLCIVVDDFPARAEELAQSPLRQRLESLTLYQSWSASSDVSKLKQTASQIEGLLGEPVPKAILNLIGKQAVLAVYPQAEGGPSGLLLTTPKQLKDAERLLDLWNVLEKAAVTQQQAGYWKRVTDRATVYYLLREGLFAMSDRESLIREIAEGKKAAVEKPLAQDPVWKQSMSRIREQSWIRVWFRPKLWGGVVEVPEIDGPQGILLKQLKSAASVVLEVDTEKGLHAGVHFNYQPGKEPKLLSRYRATYPGQAGILGVASDETLAAMTGRGGLDLVGRILDRQSTENQDQQYLRTILKGLLFDKDPYTDLLPSMGNHWSFEIRREDSQSKHPVNLLVSASLDRDWEESPNLPHSLHNLLRSAIRFLAISEGNSATDVTTEDLTGNTQISYYSSRRVLEPSVVVTKERLFLASNQDRARRAVLEESDSSSQTGPLTYLTDRDLADSQAGVFINFNTTREVLEEQPDELLEMFHVPEERRPSAKESLLLTADTLQLFDGIYGTWLCREGGWSLFWGAVIQPE